MNRTGKTILLEFHYTEALFRMPLQKKQQGFGVFLAETRALKYILTSLGCVWMLGGD